MKYARLETAALAHVDDSYYYGAYCGKCKALGAGSLWSSSVRGSAMIFHWGMCVPDFVAGAVGRGISSSRSSVRTSAM